MESQTQETAGGSPAEVPNDPGKMFIGGLSWQTSPESLREYFSKFAAAAAAAGRPKRDLGVDPEKLLALLALWQQQQQLPQRSPLDAPLEAPLGAPIAAPLFRPAGRIPGYDLTDADDWELSMDNNELDSEDDGPVGAWLEAPPYAQARVPPPPFGAQRRAAFYLPALPPPPPAAAAGPLPVALPGGGASKRETAWAGLAKEKRFMVSRKRQLTNALLEKRWRF